MIELEALLSRIDADGDEVVIHAGAAPLARLAGRRCWLADKPLSVTDAGDLVLAALPVELREQLDLDHQLTAIVERSDGRRVRATCFHHAGGAAAVFRALPAHLPARETLGLPDAVAGFAELRAGLVLLAGAPGSGRTTTVAALVERLGESRICHIVTFEEAIEARHRPAQAHVTQCEVPAASLRGALDQAGRDDVDVVVVDPLRAATAKRAAVELATTGRLVVAVVPGATVLDALERFFDAEQSDDRADLLACASDVLCGVCAQRLVPRRDGGRVAAFEIALTTSELSALVRRDRLDGIVDLVRHGQAAGMQTFDTALERLVAQGTVDYDVALHLASDREAFARTAGARG